MRVCGTKARRWGAKTAAKVRVASVSGIAEALSVTESLVENAIRVGSAFCGPASSN